MTILSAIGRLFLAFLAAAGRLMMFAGQAVWHCVHPPYYPRLILKQMLDIGYFSLPVVGLTAIFSGMVLALQSHTGFARFSAEGAVATVVILSMTRELGPVLAGLMVAGRVGAAMAAEIGTMRVTEQIDALYTMAVNPVQYLVVPRFLAGLLMVPVLSVLFTLIGMVGAYFVGVVLLNIDKGVFIGKTRWFVDPDDLTSGIIKAFVFGGILTMVGCYKGYYASGGARGVGMATTQAVVYGSVLILVADYFLTALMFK